MIWCCWGGPGEWLVPTLERGSQRGWFVGILRDRGSDYDPDFEYDASLSTWLMWFAPPGSAILKDLPRLPHSTGGGAGAGTLH